MYNNCYMIVHQFDDTKRYYIPTYPEEINDTLSVNWSDTSIVNRKSPIPSFISTGYRSVSFTITIHREMLSNSDKNHRTTINSLFRAIESCVYPNYTSGNIKVPLVTFSFGEFKVKGIIRSVSKIRKKPIVNDKYSLFDISVLIDEPINSQTNTDINTNATTNSKIRDINNNLQRDFRTRQIY